MAKVKSLPSCYAVATNDAGTDLISFEVSDKSPTIYDFDIIQLIDDNEVNLDESSSDIKYLKENDSRESCIALANQHTVSDLSNWNTDNETSVLELLQEADNQEDYSKKFLLKFQSDDIGNTGMAPNNKENAVVNYASSSSISEHHLELDRKSQVLKDSQYDSDISLADLLSNICEHSSSVENSKGLSSWKNLNSFGLSLSEGCYNSPQLTSDSEGTSYDLSVLPESSGIGIIQSSDVSLADLANSHFLSNSPKSNDTILEELSLADDLYSSEHNIGNFDLTNNFRSDLSSSNSDVNILEDQLSLADLLKTEISVSKLKKCSKDVKTSLRDTSIKGSEMDFNSSSLTDILDVENTVSNFWESQKKDENFLLDSNSLDDEIVPDIDLNFCIKKPSSSSTENYTLTSSLESTDSGFDETNFRLIKSKPISQDFASVESIYSPVKDLQSSLLNPKESLLSKAISCKPKSNKTKIEKLRKIKKDLFMKHFPQSFMDCNRQCLKMCEKVEDLSNQCVMLMNNQFNVLDQ